MKLHREQELRKQMAAKVTKRRLKRHETINKLLTASGKSGHSLEIGHWGDTIILRTPEGDHFFEIKIVEREKGCTCENIFCHDVSCIYGPPPFG